MASSTRVEKLQYKEIPTPSWRVNEVGDNAAAAATVTATVAVAVAAKIEASFHFAISFFLFFLGVKDEVVNEQLFLACHQNKL